jgi:hypothetical protein
VIGSRQNVKGFLALGADQLQNAIDGAIRGPADLHPSQVLGPVDGSLKIVEDCLRLATGAGAGEGQRSGRCKGTLGHWRRCTGFYEVFHFHLKLTDWATAPMMIFNSY